MKGLLIILIISTIAVNYHALNGQDLSNPVSFKEVTLTGGMSARFIGYTASGIEDRRRPFTYVLGANASVNLLDWSVPFSFTYSNQQYVFSQPFNQFGLSPTYKWVTVHLGYRNLNFSPYTLAGHQILGAGFEVKPGKFRFSYMQGRFRRTVQQDTTLLSIRRPVYKRTGWTARFGYATAQNNIDLIILKAKDDEGSLDFPVADQPQFALDQVLPGENLVVGVNARQVLLNRLTFNIDATTSVFVRDSRLNDAESDDIPSITNLFGSLIDLNSSAQVNNALKTSISYGHKLFNISGYYLYIDPDYESMGAYFINNDLRAFNLTGSTRLFKSKIIINGALTRQEDNLRNQKSATTRRILPSAGIQVTPIPEVGFGLQYTNYTSLQLEGNLPLDNALKTDQQNPILTFNGYFQKADTIKSHLISAFVSRSELVDNNLLTREFTQYTGNTINLTYNYTNLISGWGVSVSFNSNQLKSFNGDLPGTGYSLGVSKDWEDSGWGANLRANFSSQDDVNSTSFNGGLNWSQKIHTVSLNLNQLSTTILDQDVNEFTIFLQYGVRFNPKKKRTDEE